MELISPKHGKFSYEQEDIITFKNGLPGFENLKKYILKEVDKESPFSLLQSLEEESLAFILISPFLVKKKYEIKLNEEIINKLEVKSPQDILLYSIVTLNDKLEKITANLKAPIIININNKKGEQYIVDKEDYKIKEVVFKNK